MPIDSEAFLTAYAGALNTFDPKRVAGFCLPPTIIMDDLGKKVMDSEQELQQYFGRMFDKVKQVGAASFVPELHQTMRLSDTLYFSKMRWRAYGQPDEMLFSFATSYTLQKMADNQLKIIVAVIDDDQDQLKSIMAANE